MPWGALWVNHTEPSENGTTRWPTSDTEAASATAAAQPKPASLEKRCDSPQQKLSSSPSPQPQEASRDSLGELPGMVNEPPSEPQNTQFQDVSRQSTGLSSQDSGPKAGGGWKPIFPMAKSCSSESTGDSPQSPTPQVVVADPVMNCKTELQEPGKAELPVNGSAGTSSRQDQGTGSLLGNTLLLPGANPSAPPSPSPSGLFPPVAPSPSPSLGSRTGSNRMLVPERGESRRHSFNTASYQQAQKTEMEETLKKIDKKEEDEKAKKQKYQRQLFKTEKKQMDTEAAIRDAWVNNAKANLIFGGVIAANAVFIGAEADYRDSDVEISAGWFIAECLFASIFLFELALRVRAVWVGRLMPTLILFLEDRWNIFDSSLVICSLIELCILTPLGRQGAMNLLVVFRLLRLVRLIRVFRYFRELMLLVQGLWGAIRALVWAVALLFMILYVIAVGCTRLIGHHNTISEENQASVNDWFGSLPRSLFTLFQIVTLEGWADIVRALLEDFSQIWILFVPFIVLTNYTLLNLVTAIVVENVLLISQREQMLEVKRDEAARHQNVSMLANLFEEMDDDGNGELSLEEFQTALEDEAVVQQFQQLDIAQYEAVDLFDLLDIDHDNSITVAEFVEGCLRVRGDAKAKHLLSMQYDLQKCWTDMSDTMVEIYEKMLSIRELSDEITPQPSKPSKDPSGPRSAPSSVGSRDGSAESLSKPMQCPVPVLNLVAPDGARIDPGPSVFQATPGPSVFPSSYDSSESLTSNQESAEFARLSQDLQDLLESKPPPDLQDLLAPSASSPVPEGPRSKPPELNLDDGIERQNSGISENGSGARQFVNTESPTASESRELATSPSHSTIGVSSLPKEPLGMPGAADDKLVEMEIQKMLSLTSNHSHGSQKGSHVQMVRSPDLADDLTSSMSNNSHEAFQGMKSEPLQQLQHMKSEPQPLQHMKSEPQAYCVTVPQIRSPTSKRRHGSKDSVQSAGSGKSNGSGRADRGSGVGRRTSIAGIFQRGQDKEERRKLSTESSSTFGRRPSFSNGSALRQSNESESRRQSMNSLSQFGRIDSNGSLQSRRSLRSCRSSMESNLEADVKAVAAEGMNRLSLCMEEIVTEQQSLKETLSEGLDFLVEQIEALAKALKRRRGLQGS